MMSIAWLNKIPYVDLVEQYTAPSSWSYLHLAHIGYFLTSM